MLAKSYNRMLTLYLQDQLKILLRNKFKNLTSNSKSKQSQEKYFMKKLMKNIVVKIILVDLINLELVLSRYHKQQISSNCLQII